MKLYFEDQNKLLTNVLLLTKYDFLFLCKHSVRSYEEHNLKYVRGLVDSQTGIELKRLTANLNCFIQTR